MRTHKIVTIGAKKVIIHFINGVEFTREHYAGEEYIPRDSKQEGRKLSDLKIAKDQPKIKE